ncbi:hypothetical protein H8S23_05070 [Anaerofilum sp. BX8]|uniref:Uncharacterized protein n=1 Tax=Anaerofilum hominis TaxID=2763016 RepID=A0A923L191_9FIRM|nr:hypothetical protein [Anaerofilum hominis]MBC5580868.1 hypothetical protein [Anaerofilum hominis]
MGKMSYRQLERYCGRGDWPTEKKKTARGWGGKLSYEALEEYCGREAKPRPEKPQDKTTGRSGRSSAGSRIKPKTDTTLQQLFTPAQQDDALQLGINGEDQNTGAPPAARSPFVRVQPGTSLPQFGANGPGLGQVQPVTLGVAAAKPGSGQAGPGAGAGDQPARNSAWQQAVEAAAPVYTWQDVLTAANDVTGSQYDTLRRQAKQRGAVYNAVRDFEAAHEDGELLDFYADPSVKLNDIQMQTAKRLVREFEAKYPKTRDYDPINGMDPQAGYQMAAMMRDPQYQSYIQLLNKTDALEAAATGFTEGTGAGQVLDLLGRIGADDEGRAAMDAWKDARGAVRAAGQTQHPVASAAGTMGGKMLEYTAGKQFMGALPGVGNALKQAGNAVNRGLSGLGPAGQATAGFFTPDRVAGLLSDQMLDVAFDTIPETFDNLNRMRRQEEQGVPEKERITGWDVAAGAAQNFGVNALFNLGSEMIPAAIKAIVKKLQGGQAITDAEAAAIKSFYINEHPGTTAFRENLNRPKVPIGPKPENFTDALLKTAADGAEISADPSPRALMPEQSEKQIVRAYHGTPAEFERFALGDQNVGIHFGTEEQAEKRLIQLATDGRIIEADLSYENLKPLKSDEFGEPHHPYRFSERILESGDFTDAEKAYVREHGGKYSYLCRQEKDLAGDLNIAVQRYEHFKRDEYKQQVYELLEQLEWVGTLKKEEQARLEALAKQQLGKELSNEELFYVIMGIENRELEQTFRELGYDGFSYPNEHEGEGISYVVFGDDQIRQLGTRGYSREKKEGRITDE